MCPDLEYHELEKTIQNSGEMARAVRFPFSLFPRAFPRSISASIIPRTKVVSGDLELIKYWRRNKKISLHLAPNICPFREANSFLNSERVQFYETLSRNRLGMSKDKYPRILGSFRYDYEYEIEYEYDFRFSNQWRFQSPSSSCWF